ncbi:F-box/LRR-repeat protein 14 [Glycine max]|nr:F-box/LRR-repeat protein 14 [Glycine max]
MGGACSRKQEWDNEDSLIRGLPRRYCKCGSLKWWTSSFSYPSVDFHLRKGECPSLLDLCIQKISEDIDKYNTFSMLPRDISQLIFNNLVYSRCLTSASLEAFRDCALQDLYLGEYDGVNDNWMGVISSQGSSLLSVDLSGSDVTDFGLTYLKDCESLISLNLNYCDQISDRGLECINGLSNLTSLSFRRNDSISAQGMSSFSGLVNLVKLDLERCPGIHGGLVHLRGLTKLESLNLKWCNCIKDYDMKPLSELASLKSLEISSSDVTDFGISFLKGLQKLALLNLEGCLVTAACLDSLAELPALSNLNLNRCLLSDNGCKKFSRLENLKILNLGFNVITDACLVHLKGLTKLESLNLDSCKIGDEGLVNLAGRCLNSSFFLVSFFMPSWMKLLPKSFSERK